MPRINRVLRWLHGGRDLTVGVAGQFRTVKEAYEVAGPYDEIHVLAGHREVGSVLVGRANIAIKGEGCGLERIKIKEAPSDEGPS